MSEEKFFALCGTILLGIGVLGVIAVEDAKALR